MRCPVAVLVTGLLLALLTACLPVAPRPATSFPAEPLLRTPQEPITEEQILAYCPDTPAEHFTGFTSYEIVYACRADEHRPSDGTSTYGPWQSAYRILDPRAILAGYALPNDTRIVASCPEGSLDPLILWVHSAGTVRAIYAPVNGCGYARGEMVDLYQRAERDLVAEVDTGAPLDARDTPAEH